MYTLLGASTIAVVAATNNLEDLEFAPIVDGLPPGFVFGTASAAYQVRRSKSIRCIKHRLGINSPLGCCS